MTVFILPMVLGFSLGLCLVAVLLGERAHKRSTSTANQFICWSSLVTWLIPPLGIFTAGYTIGLFRRLGGTRISTVLASACAALSVSNASLGAYLAVQAPESPVVVITREVGPIDQQLPPLRPTVPMGTTP